jgi:hypothetical protein
MSAEKVAAGLRRDAAGATKRTVIRLETGDLEFEERLRGDIQFQASAAAVNQGASGDHQAARLFDNADRLSCGAARRPDIFNDENSLAGPDLEAAAQDHLSGPVALRKKGSHSEGSCDLVTNQDSAERRRGNTIHGEIVKLGGQGATQVLSMLGILQNEGALNVSAAVPAAGKFEVTLPNRSNFVQELEQIFASHQQRPRGRRDSARPQQPG